jgi:hypothetical protein
MQDLFRSGARAVALLGIKRQLSSVRSRYRHPVPSEWAGELGSGSILGAELHCVALHAAWGPVAGQACSQLADPERTFPHTLRVKVCQFRPGACAAKHVTFGSLLTAILGTTG